MGLSGLSQLCTLRLQIGNLLAQQDRPACDTLSIVVAEILRCISKDGFIRSALSIEGLTA